MLGRLQFACVPVFILGQRLGQTGAASGQLGGLQVEAGGKAAAAFRQRRPQGLAAPFDALGLRQLVKETGGIRPHADAPASQRHGARRDVPRAMQQKQGFDGALHRFAVRFLAHRQQPVLQNLRGDPFIRLRLHSGDCQVKQIGRIRLGVDEDGAAQGVLGEAGEDLFGQCVEHRFAGMQPDALRALLRTLDAKAGLGRWGIALQGRQQAVKGAGALRDQGEMTVQVAVDVQAQEGGAFLHEAPHIAGQQLQVALPLQVPAQPVQAGGHFAPGAVNLLLSRPDVGHPFAGQRLADAGLGAALACLGQRLDHVVLEGDVLEQPADHVEHLVRAQLPPNRLQLLQQHLQHPPLPGAGRHQVDDVNVPLLAVAVDAAHALLQAGGVPRDVVVGHQGAELQVDALPGGVRGDQVAGAVGAAEALHLPLPLRPGHAAVNLRHPPGVAQPLQAAHQIVQGVPMLGEDQPLLLSAARRLQHFPQLLELGFIAGIQNGPRPGA